MPAISRLGDLTAGHDSFPPRPSDEASSDVFINGIGAVRIGDHFVTHCNPFTCHDGVDSAGSSTVFINGRAAARIRDSISCGDIIAAGSPSVFAGG
jgi:uncharacterized Zn-binding protein involved in type VI secretion